MPGRWQTPQAADGGDFPHAARLRPIPSTIARLFGATRAAGTIIWASDLSESRETSGGGKGRPRTTQYSYTVSLAVALSSRPIEGVGRIWADGNLLRGAAGDLKTGGTLRVYLGHRDQQADPLLAAALGAQCPAHRGLAYAVLEDLQLGDFGNRIPALSFEVVADGGGEGLIAALLEPASIPVAAGAVPDAAPLAGFAHDGGSLAAALEAIGELVPIAADARGEVLTVAGAEPAPVPAPVPAPGPAAPLPAAIAWADGEFGTRTGRRMARGAPGGGPALLRYYDSARDYQPGLQRAPGRAASAGERTIELPATLSAQGAASLIAQTARRAGAAAERMEVRVASLDPAIAPGREVSHPASGIWRVESWEWRSGGVELALVRPPAISAVVGPVDPGVPWRPADRLPALTLLDAFELPWDGTGAADAARVQVAAGAGEGRWGGAALYVERGGALVPAGTLGPLRATLATLAAPLAPSPALMFEPSAALMLACEDRDADFATVDGAALAAGANRLLVGEEILQFMVAEPLGAGQWRLRGLLRGRGATEAEARAGHGAGTRVILLDQRPQTLDPGIVDPANERLAAIGSGDGTPVFAAVRAPGRSLRPLPPVHPSAATAPGGALRLSWTRRARGAWQWQNGIDVPLVEEREAYEVGAGPVDAPLATWPCAAPELLLEAAALAAIPPGATLWVCQIGTHARSPALLLHILT